MRILVSYLQFYECYTTYKLTMTYLDQAAMRIKSISLDSNQSRKYIKSFYNPILIVVGSQGHVDQVVGLSPGQTVQNAELLINV